MVMRWLKEWPECFMQMSQWIAEVRISYFCSPCYYLFLMCRGNSSIKKLSLWDLKICLMLSSGFSLEQIQERQSLKLE